MEVLKGTLMSIIDYIDCFHDGGIDSIKHKNNTVELDIESFEILSEWRSTEFSLTKYNTIKGILILTNVKNIFVNREPSSDINRRGNGEISDLIIKGNKLELGVNWYTFSDRGAQSIYEYIIFEFKDMTWIEHDKETSF